MVQQLDHCPKHWKRGCYPQPCDTPSKPLSGPPQATPSQPGQVHNIVYLVDEHNITNDVKQTVTRNNSKTLQKRYAWHHQVANLNTFNVGEIPDTIELHEKIANPKANPNFRWEDFMFDIPGGNAACRVAIVARADEASDKTLTGPGGAGGVMIDRVVGFAGIYPDNQVPLGPIVQVRRDDAYRRLGASLNGAVKVAWHCAYYITKETPMQPTPSAKSPLEKFSLVQEGNPDEAPVTDQASATDQTSAGQGSEVTLTYDQIMDQNVNDDVSVVPNGEPWGGMVFGFTVQNVKNSDPNDEEALEVYDDSALDELKVKEGEVATS